MKKLMTVIYLLSSCCGVFGLEAIEGAKKDIESFRKTMSTKLHQIEKDLTSLHAEAEKKQDAALKETIQQYEQTRDKLRSDLNHLQADAQDQWKAAKAKLSSSIDSLYDKVQKALKD